MLSIECIRDVRQWDAIRQDWDRLASGWFMREFSWLRAWWDGYGPLRHLLILVARNDGKICSIAPMCIENSRLHGRQLQFLGSGKACSDDAGLLSDGVHDRQSAELFVEYLCSGPARDDWDRMDLDGIQMGNPAMEGLAKEFDNAGVRFQRSAGESCWRIPLKSSMEEFFSGVSKRARRTLKLLQRDYIVNGRAELLFSQTLSEAQSQLGEISELHQARWKERGVNGCFGHNGFELFLRSSIHNFWECDRVRVARLAIDGQIVAGAIAYVNSNELCIYLTGMDPAFEEHRPGWMLNLCLAQYCIENHLESINFLRGDEEYKLRLGGIPTSQQRWIAAAPRALPRLRFAAYQTGLQLRNWWKRSRTDVGSRGNTIDRAEIDTAKQVS